MARDQREKTPPENVKGGQRCHDLINTSNAKCHPMDKIPQAKKKNLKSQLASGVQCLGLPKGRRKNNKSGDIKEPLVTPGKALDTKWPEESVKKVKPASRQSILPSPATDCSEKKK